MNEAARAYGQLVAFNHDLSANLGKDKSYFKRNLDLFIQPHVHFPKLMADTSELLQKVERERYVDLEMKLSKIIDKIPADGITKPFDAQDQGVAYIAYYHSRNTI